MMVVKGIGIGFIAIIIFMVGCGSWKYTVWQCEQRGEQMGLNTFYAWETTTCYVTTPDGATIDVERYRVIQ